LPNEKGIEALRALGDHGPTSIAVFTAASETFSRRNTNASIAETFARFVPIVDYAQVTGLHLRGYISCVIACPFEGLVSPDRVIDIAEKLIELGITEIDLGDTIGAAMPSTIRALLDAARKRFGEFPSPFAGSSWDLTLHLHDTFGRAADCVKAALDLGVRSFDGSVAGLGGCPYASTPGKRAPGNISTQTLVRTIHDAGYTTNVDMDKLEEAGRFAMKIVTAARKRATDAPPRAGRADKPPVPPESQP
jgi:hydroxymethylglutaryl-CoA lyase